MSFQDNNTSSLFSACLLFSDSSLFYPFMFLSSFYFFLLPPLSFLFLAHLSFSFSFFFLLSHTTSHIHYSLPLLFLLPLVTTSLIHYSLLPFPLSPFPCTHLLSSTTCPHYFPLLLITIISSSPTL